MKQNVTPAGFVPCDDERPSFRSLQSFQDNVNSRTKTAKHNRRPTVYVELAVFVIIVAITCLYYYALAVLNSALPFSSFKP